MSTNVYEFRHSISNARTEFMSVEESAATPVLVAAVDNDRMALLALKGIFAATPARRAMDVGRGHQ